MKGQLYYDIFNKCFVREVETNLRLSGVIVSLVDLNGNGMGGVSKKAIDIFYESIPEIELLSILYGEE